MDRFKIQELFFSKSDKDDLSTMRAMVEFNGDLEEVELFVRNGSILAKKL